MIRVGYSRLILLVISVVYGSSVFGLNANAQSQAGGGTISDAMGGAALIFHKPQNPALHQGSGSTGAVGGGKVSKGRRSKITPTVATAAATHERTIAKANAARSAPTPRYTEAEQQYKLAATEDPNDARAHAGLGNTYLDQARFTDAVKAYQQALKLQPDYMQAYQPLAYSYVRLGRDSEAADTLKQALAYDANNPEIYNNLSYAYVHAGKFAEAIEAGEQAITLLGKTGEAYKLELQVRNEVLSNAYKNLGNAYNELKRYNEAADALKHATEIEPKNAAANFNLGLALYNGGRYSEAIEAYKAVVELKPLLAGAHFNLGLTYLAIGDKTNAAKEYDALKPLNAQMAAQLQNLMKN